MRNDIAPLRSLRLVASPAEPRSMLRQVLAVAFFYAPVQLAVIVPVVRTADPSDTSTIPKLIGVMEIVHAIAALAGMLTPAAYADTWRTEHQPQLT